jgi:hypothetical protein
MPILKVVEGLGQGEWVPSNDSPVDKGRVAFHVCISLFPHSTRFLVCQVAL